ncbi:hypothetical protein [Microcystis phage Mwe-JY25]
MPIFQSDAARGLVTPPMPINAGTPTEMRYQMQIPSSGLLVGDIFELAAIPPNMRVSNLMIDVDDLDTNASPLISLDVGIMSGQFGDTNQARTCGSEFWAAFIGARTGGIFMPTAVGALRTGKSPVARSIGVRIVALAATPAAGILGLTVSCVD